jgi:translation initiation factor IF-3
VRLVGEKGEMIGVCSLENALIKAHDYGLDLVEISPNASPPVCKLMDFGKFKYESKKKAQDAKKKQRVVVTKEIKLRPNIDKVKITLKFKGREITHHELGMNLLHRVLEETKEYAKVEIEPRFEGKQLLMQIAPK